MPSIGPISPSSSSEETGYARAWSNLANIYTSNDVHASIAAGSAGDDTNILVASGFDFSTLPTGCIIDGVVFTVEAKKANIGVVTFIKAVIAVDLNEGNDQSAGTVLTASDAVHTFGSSTETHGLIPSRLSSENIRNSFSVKIQFDMGSATNTCTVDHITATVYYTTTTGSYSNRYSGIINQIIGR